MSLDCWDLDRTNYVSVNLLITVLTRTGASDDLRAASIQPLWERQILTEDNAALDELGHKGMLEGHDVEEVVLKLSPSRLLRICVLTSLGKLVSSLVEGLRADQPGETREQSQEQAHQGEVWKARSAVRKPLQVQVRPVYLYTVNNNH